MKMQLEDLSALQEVDSRLDEIGKSDSPKRVAARGKPGTEAARLIAEREELAGRVRLELLRYYERVRQRHARAVVGTVQGSCMGCFTRRPTSMASRPGGFETCERCGRILIRSEMESPNAAGPPSAVAPKSSGKGVAR